MQIGIPKESVVGENRVAATPETVKKLISAGHSIVIERGDYGIYVCYKNNCPGMINLEALEELCLLSHK